MIDIGGKDRPIHGNINGLIELKKEHGIDIVNGFSKESFSFEVIRSLVYVALKYGHRKEYPTTAFEVTIEDVGDWLTPGNMNIIVDKVIHSFVGDIDVKEGTQSGEPLGGH
jgi:hypothetical protein